jgi:hypothetical protein
MSLDTGMRSKKELIRANYGVAGIHRLDHRLMTYLMFNYETITYADYCFS